MIQFQKVKASCGSLSNAINMLFCPSIHYDANILLDLTTTLSFLDIKYYIYQKKIL